ncbi:MAG: T9SS type A sorting domain-containing protein [Phaeodactylibacter sp.]|nr:T9SS type A sorting domain-containing protein [Phaeodactylibacter sp.]
MKYAAGVFLLWFALAGLGCREKQNSYEETESGAAQAMEEWALLRSYPDGRIWQRNLSEAFEQRQLELVFRDENPDWEALGPKNFGGRTISLAFHPTDPNIIYVGAAGGGLWKTTTAGVGAQAWERVPLGYPVLGVSAIAINPDNPDEMYIGTGEVYNYTVASPGVSDRLTRGSYGIGILKTSDGGQSWQKSLDWSYEEMRGVWDVAVNPENPNTVFAATTEGIFRTYNAGATWDMVHDYPMGVDIELYPLDTNIVFVTHGGYQSPASGIFRSDDGGDTFTLVPGLPSGFDGRARFSISPSDPEVMYISLANAFASIGLFRSSDGGASWSNVNPSDVAKYQGWYSHDVAIKPDDPNTIIYTGIDVFKSANGGAVLSQKTFWYAWFLDQTPVGGPEGPPDYVHADIHGAYYSPFNPNTIFLVTDGGVFASEDNGETWAGRNGGYQSQQFYANFSNSPTNPNLAMGGLQDNATAIYLGSDSWDRVIGGDGMCTAIHPTNESILYGSSQNLNVRRSNNGGASFFGLNIVSANGEQKNFNGPFELDPQNPDVLYAGAQRLHVSYDGGQNWAATSVDYVDPDNGNPILAIAVSPFDNNKIFVGTAPLLGPNPRVFRSTNGGADWLPMAGLPDRTPMDIAFHPADDNILYAVFSGFGTNHVFKTEDSGANWEAIDNGLPDVPANTIVIDPDQPSDIYLGNDLGVYASFDGGQSWEAYSVAMADAVMVYDLSISPANRMLRAATHGLGVYQTSLREIVSNHEVATLQVLLKQNYPNPVQAQTTIAFELPEAAQIQLRLFNSSGQEVLQLQKGLFAAGKHTVDCSLNRMSAGMYAYVLEGRFQSNQRQAFREVRTLVKR